MYIHNYTLVFHEELKLFTYVHTLVFTVRKQRLLVVNKIDKKICRVTLNLLPREGLKIHALGLHGSFYCTSAYSILLTLKYILLSTG